MLGIALTLVVVFAVVTVPGGTEFSLPDAVESVSPANGETVQRQIELRIDMQVGYEIELFVDGVPIPPTEIAFVQATGRYSWVPGPGRALAEWPAGLHTARMTFERVSGRFDTGELHWTFRIQ